MRPNVISVSCPAPAWIGVVAVLAEIGATGQSRLLQTHYLPYADSLRSRLLALHAPQPDEIHLAACAANELARLYAEAVSRVLNGIAADTVRAIGCHGQTLRHRPADGYTLQIGNAALLAELTGITVVADFGSRDIAKCPACGQKTHQHKIGKTVTLLVVGKQRKFGVFLLIVGIPLIVLPYILIYFFLD